MPLSYLFTLFVQMNCFWKCLWSLWDLGCGSTHTEPCLNGSSGLCRGCAAVLLHPVSRMPTAVIPRDTPEELEKQKGNAKFVFFMTDRGCFDKSLGLIINGLTHPGLFNKEDLLIQTVQPWFPDLVAHHNLRLTRYPLHRFPLRVT